jgi:hypothetical protein
MQNRAWSFVAGQSRCGAPCAGAYWVSKFYGACARKKGAEVGLQTSCRGEEVVVPVSLGRCAAVAGCCPCPAAGLL